METLYRFIGVFTPVPVFITCCYL